MLFVAAAWAFVALVTLVIVIVLVLSVAVVLDYDAGVMFCVLAGDHTRERLVKLVLLLFYWMYDGLGLRLSFYLLWE